MRDNGHRIAREAALVESDAQSVREDAEDLASLVQMAVDAANGESYDKTAVICAVKLLIVFFSARINL